MLDLILLFVLILSHSRTFIVVNSLNDEGIALLSFKQSIKDDPSGSLNNWISSDETPCSWNGITCKQQTVFSVSIPNKKLSGFLSSSLGSLSQLRHLNLRSNNLSGGLSSLLFNPQKLQSLVLYGNSLSGTLPIEVGNLENIQILDLSHNFLNGSLPSSLIQCRKLRNLDFSHNNFSGTLPYGFGKNLVLLEKLDLSYNEFGGFIPDDLGYLSNLQETFDLSHNKFNGSIPASLGNLPEKAYIDLTYNELTGPIPQNGALINRGPTAFIWNSGLCGPPLKNLCSNESSSPSPFPYLPNNYPPEGGGPDLSKAGVIAIVVGDVIGICVIGLLFSYCYSRIWSRGKKYEGFEKGSKSRKECLCFRKDESASLSENGEQCDLVHLDARGAFDLDELLKASAFVIGKTGIGLVYKVVLEDGLILAVRRLGEGGWQRFKEFQTEVEAIGKLRHSNIATLRAYYWSVDEKLLIYDFIPNGNLARAIHGKPGQVTFNPLSWSMRLKIMKGIANGLVYLHEYSPKKYVHGDLKPSNILLGQEMDPKISDFGLHHLASIAGGPPVLQSSPMVSYYQAPEALKGAKPSQKWDVYSYGIILLEMVTGKSEMDLVRWMELCVEEKRPIYDILDPYLVEDAAGEEEEEIIAVVKIAMLCTQSNPDRRPPMRILFESLERL